MARVFLGASRRTLQTLVCASAVALSLAGGVVAAPTQTSRPLTELFPGLERYWRTPEAKRTMFRMRYCVQGPSGKETPLRVDYAAPQGSRTLKTDPDGCFAALPALEDLKANPFANAQGDSVFKIIVALEPATPLKRVIALADLRAAIRQADDAARAAAGPLAWGAPHLDSVHFDLDATAAAPDAVQEHEAALQRIRLDIPPSGFAVFADGTRRALPVRDGRVMVAPEDAAIRRAQWIELSGAPLTARIGFSTPIKR